jgi:hypothetical protein
LCETWESTKLADLFRDLIWPTQATCIEI